MNKKVLFLKRRRQLLIDIINELINDKIYTEIALAKKLWTYRQRINWLRKWGVLILPDEVESYLTIIWIK